ncbi:MAG: DMT family transporter [Eubacteriales bacterium]|jgi:drug/metabolite transporter (DMT)-like permease
MKRHALTRSQALLVILFGAVFWSTGGLLVKLVPGNPMGIAAMRSLLALPMMFLIFPPRTLRITKKAWLYALFPACTGHLYIFANKLTTAANAIVLQFISPVFIILLGLLLFRERPKKADLLVVAATMTGIVLFFLDGLSSGGMLGNFLAICSGFCIACYYICMNRSGEDAGTIVILAQVEIFLIGLPALITDPLEFTPTAIVGVVLLGLVQRGLGEAMYAKGAPYCSPLDAILVSMLEPLLNPVWVMLAFHEVPPPLALAGGILVIGSVVIWNLYKMKEEKQAQLACSSEPDGT